MRENIHAIHGNYTYEDPKWGEINYEKEFIFLKELSPFSSKKIKSSHKKFPHAKKLDNYEFIINTPLEIITPHFGGVGTLRS